MSEPRRRAEQKERTRRAILDAALRLSADTPLAAISLRTIAGEAGIKPSSFYVHFDSTDAVGLALVEESFESLRAVLIALRQGAGDEGEMLRAAMDELVAQARDRQDHFGFIARERFSGSAVVREAVRTQLVRVETDLAIDLARLTPLNWASEDVQLMAKMIVVSVVQSVGDLITGQLDSPEDVGAQVTKMLRMQRVGTLNWRPYGSATD